MNICKDMYTKQLNNQKKTSTAHICGVFNILFFQTSKHRFVRALLDGVGHSIQQKDCPWGKKMIETINSEVWCADSYLTL